jgi:penicillin-binding protein 1A
MIEPRLVSKIVSKYGSVIYETRPKEIANFTKPEQAYLMTSILQDVIKRGTGKNAAVKGIELAGKTGTTNDYIDAWFCGYSPTITTIVWYGRDKYKSIGKNMTGGRVAAPAFSYFYYKLLELDPKIQRKFIKPKGVHVGIVDGKKEFYTSISPLPKRAKSKIASDLTKKEKYNEDMEELNKNKNKKFDNSNVEKEEDIGNDIVEIYDNNSSILEQDSNVEELF